MRTTSIKAIGYWVTTAVVALSSLVGGAFDLARPPEVVAALAHLGYPAYVGSILGVWKVLGGVALLAPRLPRVKEWAYAGIFFDLTGAAVSHAVKGDSAGDVVVPVVLAALTVVSWALRPQSRVLGEKGSGYFSPPERGEK